MSRVKDQYWNEMMDNSESAIELRHWEDHMAALFTNFRPVNIEAYRKTVTSAEQKLEDIKKWRAKYKI